MIYYTTQRPASVGTIPTQGLKSIENYAERTELEFCNAWSKVEYDRELTEEELRLYEMDDNSPKTPTFIDLESYDPTLIFHGSEEEISLVEKKSARNRQILKALYMAVLKNKLSYVFKTTKHIHDTEFVSSNVHILTKSAKYEDALQLTSVSYINGEYAYMNCDSRIRDVKDFLREFGEQPGTRIYYSA